MLIGFEDPDDWWEELLLRNPAFQARVAKARQNFRQGRFSTIEEVREEYNVEQSPSADESRPLADD
jgi:hypothetical protein